MIRFAVCDDDLAMTAHIKHMIVELMPSFKQEFEVLLLSSGEEFCDYLNETNEAFDIVFMDIEMKAVTGVEAGRKLRENIANDFTLLIFVSSHRSYYHEIIDLNVFCFIPKPIVVNEFQIRLDKAVKHIMCRQKLPPSVDFAIEKNKKVIHVPENSIMYLTSEARRITLHTEAQNYTYYGRLDEEETKLSKNMFRRVHKSHIINFSYVTTITTKHILMSDGRNFSISERYREEIKQAYHRYRMEEML